MMITFRNIALTICLGFISLDVFSYFVKAKVVKVEAAANSILSSKIIKCEDDDMSCFIRAAEKCKPATLTKNYRVAVFDTEISQIAFYEIKGGSRNKCQFYLKILDWQAKPHEFTEEEKEIIKAEAEKIRKSILKNGGTVTELTEEEIKEREETRKEIQKMTEKRMKDAIGTDGICTFKAANLAALFERWKDGNFSSSDLPKADCEGTYFSKENGF